VKGMLLLLATAGVLAACGSEDSQEEAGGEDPPAVAELVCGSDGPELLTPVVRAQRDGVHVRVRNEKDHEAEFDYEVTSGDTGGGGSLAPSGTSMHVVPFAAESVSIGCAPEALDRVDLRVVDPGDDLKGADPECSDLRSADFTGVGREPVVVARRYLRNRGLRPGDVIEPAVSIAGEFPVVRVVRDGRVVAKLIFDASEARRMGGTVEMCADFGQ
jgi:hypothetical protein